VGSINALPAGTYMIWAQVEVLDGASEPDGNCSLSVNGTVQASTVTPFELKNGDANLTIVSAATLTGGGSTVEVDCTSTDNTTTANVNLALVAVDALN
jgi:hypothetical protein